MIIGITGFSASGKTRFSKTLREKINDSVLLVSQDSYYLPKIEGDPNDYNFDSLNALDLNKLNSDIELLKDAIWNGTKSLISRSKFGQMPRLLLFVIYKEPNFFIGDLDNLIEIKSDLRDEQIRKPEDYKIDISTLLDQIELHKDKIENIEFAVDDRMKFVRNDEEINLKDLEKFTEISL